ncbi:MAG: hypothetical protein J7642_21255 [Cyanobacteria bacterium SBC]|nr:hypothetical protein [Cyanobacteria bacterium SBC]
MPTRIDAQLDRIERQLRQRGATQELDLTGYRDRPLDFFFDKLKVRCTDTQRQIVESVLTNRETNARAGHGIGKTYLGAALVLWWVFARRGLAITTAPTQRQVKELLWGEIRKLYDKNRRHLGGSRLELSVRLSESARAYGFTAAHYSTDSFQGIHSSSGLLVILDEANGISTEIDDGANSCTTGEGDRLLRIGNPVCGGTAFEDACGRTAIALPVWSHPNVADKYELHSDGIHRLKPDAVPPFEYPVPGAVSVEWIEGIREKKGEGSAYWEGRVEARFPTSNAASIVPMALLEQGRARYDADPDAWDARARSLPRRWGADVGGGEDDHALAFWQGPVLYLCESHSSSQLDTLAFADLVSSRAGKGEAIAIDRVGVGKGSLDRLLVLGTVAIGKSNGDPSPEKDYKNWATWCAWQIRLGLQRGELAIAPLGKDEQRIFNEFDKTYYREEADKRTALEPKDETKKRLKGESPDRRDAVLMAFGAPVRRRTRRGKPEGIYRPVTKGY